MIVSFRNLVLAAAALSTTAAFALEQQRRVEVPFDFVAQNHAYHAGIYNVSIDLSRSLVVLRSVGEPNQSEMWMMRTGVSDPMNGNVKLTFDVTAEEHVLKTIEFETFTTPNLDAKPKHNVESIRVVESSTSVGE